ncbi:MAG: hypothetical protein V7637_245 [Mycobacteriales bacterium]
MSAAGSGYAAAWAVARAQLIALRRFLVHLGWVVLSALAAAAACSGLGYVANEAFREVAPPADPAGADPADPAGIDAVVARDAPRGIREIEAYIAADRTGGRRVARADGDDGEPRTGSTPA